VGVPPPLHPEEDDVTLVVAENQTQVIAAMGEMNKMEKDQLNAEARKIQSNVRAWILRRQYQEVREAAKKVQALAKGHLARRHFRELREKASATLVIQKSLRAHIKAKRLAKEHQQQQQAPTNTTQGDGGGSGSQIQMMMMDSQRYLLPTPTSASFVAPSPAGSGSLDGRRFSAMVNAHAAVDEFILSSEDLFDVNMRDE